MTEYGRDPNFQVVPKEGFTGYVDFKKRRKDNAVKKVIRKFLLWVFRISAIEFSIKNIDAQTEKRLVDILKK